MDDIVSNIEHQCLVDTKSTILRQHAFRNTFSGPKVPMVESKVVVDEVQVCKKDKLCGITTAESLQGYLWDMAG